MIICIVVGLILVGLLCYSAYSIMTPNDDNNTTEMNLSLNDTNNTTNETVTKTSSSTQKSSSKKSSDDRVYFDEELNTYFDKNDRSAYDGQFEKGTSKSEMKEALAEMERESNL